MGGPGSGRRPWIKRKRDDLILCRGPDGHLDYLPPPKGGPSERTQAAVVALTSGAARTVTEALRQAGYAESAGTGPREALSREFKAVAERNGVTADKLMSTVAEALEAKRQVITKDGSFETPDTDARLRAVDLGMRVHGVGQERTPGAAVTVVIMPMRELQVRDSTAIEAERQPK